MKFGSVVYVHRGSFHRLEGIGKNRQVKAKLLFARGNEKYVQLLEDDAYASVSPHSIGEKGWFSRSAVQSEPFKICPSCGFIEFPSCEAGCQRVICVTIREEDAKAAAQLKADRNGIDMSGTWFDYIVE